MSTKTRGERRHVAAVEKTVSLLSVVSAFLSAGAPPPATILAGGWGDIYRPQQRDLTAAFAAREEPPIATPLLLSLSPP